MDLTVLLGAILLGIVEGATEFIPVSSTGHLILLVEMLGFQGPPGRVFEVVIQLGAILAVCWRYRVKLLRAVLDLPSEPGARRFAASVLVAFLPAAVVGLLAHDFVKSVLFSPWVVSVALVVGGIAILAVERLVREPPQVLHADAVPLPTALKIGFFQLLALIPGTSRSAATILGGMILRLDRKAAAEFSFFLAIPTMLGAATVDLAKNWGALDGDGLLVIAVGFVAAFLSALVVVGGFVAFVSRHGFGPFAWYRIAVGLLMLGLLSAGIA